ncbi:type IV pilus assembly protein PilM [Cryobacterium melibiosiphilum]|uniref:type IV pilus assembly protein PilM n=1 Tax=Cryobacterium melibiosiphilum TaxID=995039 RepID=UPI0013146504|nr:type IV pilus assembly protein PilM [Cryobacterium melibiosiphilum]
MAPRVVGIDIGSSAVRAVELSGAGTDNPVLLHYYEQPLEVGAIVRGEVVDPDAVAEALTLLWTAGGFTSRDVVIGMGDYRVVVRSLTVPSMSMRRIRESLPFQVKDLVSVPVKDGLLDFYPVSETPGEGDAGPQTVGLLIAAVKDVVLANVKAIRLAKLNPVEVDLVPFALTRAIHRMESAEDIIAEIDIGAGTTSVVVTVDGVPQFVRLIPAGASDVIKALKTRLDVDEAEAIRLKNIVGMARTVAPDYLEAAQIVHEVSMDLLSSLRNTITYFSNTRLDITITQIVLNGGGSRLPGLAAELTAQTKLPVIFAELTGIALGDGLNADAVRATEGTFLVACGLALGSRANGALEMVIGGAPRADLLPPEVKEARSGRVLRRRLGLGVVAVGLIVAVVTALVTGESVLSDGELADAQAESATLLTEVAQYSELGDVEGVMTDTRTARDLAGSTEINWQEYLAVVRAALPADVSVGTATVDGASAFEPYAAAESVPGAVATLNLSLTSPSLTSVSGWLSSLSTLPGYASASIGGLTRAEDGSYTTALVLVVNAEVFSNRFVTGD